MILEHKESRTKLAATQKTPQGFRWFPLLPGRKGGRKTYVTETDALLAAMKAMRFKRASVSIVLGETK